MYITHTHTQTFLFKKHNKKDSRFPGFPYLVGSFITALALATSLRIPTEDEYADYVDEKRAESEGEAVAERQGLLSDHSKTTKTTETTSKAASGAAAGELKEGGKSPLESHGRQLREMGEDKVGDGHEEDGDDEEEDEWSRAAREAAERESAFRAKQREESRSGGD